MNEGTTAVADTTTRPQLTRLQRRLVIGVAIGAALIAATGFVGSYAAVAALAHDKGFGWFARAFPIGVDAGILVLLALDLLLTWLRMPLALLRHTAWMLTAATIAFNGAAAWPDPVGTGMHAVIPVLFVVIVEAARHAIGRTADITADRYMQPVRISRWLLDPVRTFVLWRRMKLWELRSYDEVIRLERERKIERARLRARHGRRWRSKAPFEEVLALRLTRYGEPIAPADEDAPAPAAVAPAAAPEEIAPAPQRPALDAAPPSEGAPARPVDAPAPAPEQGAPTQQGAPARPAAPDAPADEGAPQRPAPPAAPDTGGQPAPTRAEAKRRVRALYDELDARPGEGRIVAVLKALDGYPYTSRRHAQKLRDEIEAAEPKLTERGTDNVRALTGT